MQRIFLSYTYKPHPDYAKELDELERTVRRVIEAMGLRVTDGKDLGGRAVEAEVERRIDDADALIALFTPQADNHGEPILPEYVGTEFQRARKEKATLRVLHADLEARGLGAGNEHVLFQTNNMLDVVMKLLQTLALWKKESGRAVKIKVQPEQIALTFSDNPRNSCDYQLKIDTRQPAMLPQRTQLWLEEGNKAFVLVPNYVEGAMVMVNLTVDGNTWRSPFVQPNMGTIELTKI